jgi:putative tricarboxylic transport membrane protein
MNSMISFGNDWTVFFTRPISGAVMVLVVLTLLLPLIAGVRARRRAAT